MPTQKQYDVTLQKIRDIDCKIAVLDFDYALLDELSGITTSISMSVDADSDIRRTADISIVLKDDLSVSPSQSFYWQAGNKYWFDKYVQIYTSIKDVRTDEYVWVNQGIYCINAPSISYDATSNNLSFQAVDLMSKLTGMRNGQMEGMTYTVASGSSIKGAVEGILLEQGFTQYILYDAPEPNVPQDISIDAGGTAYDLLCQLRDINSNWEMFFDVDGVFHWQQIPSGKILLTPTTISEPDLLVTSSNVEFVTSDNQTIEVYQSWQKPYDEYTEPTPLVDGAIWDKTYVNHSYNTSFEDVKNCVQVLGKMHQPSEVATVEIAGGSIRLILNKEKSQYLNSEWIIGFEIDVDGTAEPKALATNIVSIYILDNARTQISYIDISRDPITFGNEQFVVKMTVGANISTATSEYLGFMQPRATAIENNPDSPFYIGTSTQYTCKAGTAVDFASEREIVVTDVNSSVVGNVLYIDVRPWISAADFSAATQGDEWLFRVHVKLSNDTPVYSMVVYAAGQTMTGTIKNMHNQVISLDYSQDYMLVVSKGTVATPIVGMLYYPTPASLLPMSTTSEINLPKFNNQVRYVCSGDEYDNIYSNSLAEQRARYEIYLRSRLHDNISITTVPVYWLDVNTIIEFNLEEDGQEGHDLWLVKSISTDFGVTGTQTINAMRYYPLYADISLENLATQ